MALASGVVASHISHVHAGAKGLFSGAGENGTDDFGIGLYPRPDVAKFPGHGGVERIVAFGSVESDGGHAVLGLVEQRLVTRGVFHFDFPRVVREGGRNAWGQAPG